MNRSALRAAVVIAAVYGHFLIFAQFAFVELLRIGGVSGAAEIVVLGTMAAAGVAGGFLAAWCGATPTGVRWALGVAGLSAALAPWVGGMAGALGVAVATGGALGVATVSLAALLPGWCGVAWVGLGTGLGYGCCNVPWVFTQTPAGQAWVAVGFAGVGLLAVPQGVAWRGSGRVAVFSWWGALGLFAALVWLDSAAFFIIQHVPDLKAGTWGDGLLWRNAGVHFAVAVGAGWWLARSGARVLPVVAWGLLAVAALAVDVAATRSLAGWGYPAGVSLYATALVAWPGWFTGADGPRSAAWQAARLFSVAGWLASANGIGMAQSLNRVPPIFVVAAGLVVIGVAVFSNKNPSLPAVMLTHFKRNRSLMAVAAVAVTVAVGFGRGKPPTQTAAARGRQVYLAEGCIHCHSQYVRPGSPDEAVWGAARAVDEALAGVPVLIGNRRQGPDLATVGARRSAAWLHAHFLNPQQLVPGSPMPSYAPLFADGRGEALIAYLQSTAIGWVNTCAGKAADWFPSKTATAGTPADGLRLFARLCSACHGEGGRGDGPLAAVLSKPPANLAAGPFLWTAGADSLELRISRVVKFGLPGTDMAGHEVLSDGEVLALTDYVRHLRKP